MEAGEEGDREESCGSCRHKATVYCRAQIWIYDHGKWRVLHWAWGSVEILLGPFSSFLVLFPHSLCCTLHSSEDKSTALTITLSQAFNILLHPYSSAANQSINLHAWWNMSHDLQILRRFHTRPTWSRSDIRASSQRFFFPLHLWIIQINQVRRLWFASFTMWFWGRNINQSSCLCLNKLNKQTLCFHDWINKLTLKDNTVSYCLYMEDPATFLASNSVLVPPFPLRSACLFCYGRVCIVTSLIS